ncbi:hypothetical protein F2P81_005589 [Scophthalmus maximus]|uniref:Uncharacterized protein n=1 Tax=Scophthalmus maximus TaxID=52904 RepID=A0A6A4T709_SCOMX|nr:hypothetical protein F2P81_005589 [Scophthalmus maximus]
MSALLFTDEPNQLESDHLLYFEAFCDKSSKITLKELNSLLKQPKASVIVFLGPFHFSEPSPYWQEAAELTKWCHMLRTP